MLTLFILFLILLFAFISVEVLADKKYLNTKQYRLYMTIIFVLFLFLVGQIEQTNL